MRSARHRLRRYRTFASIGFAVLAGVSTAATLLTTTDANATVPFALGVYTGAGNVARAAGFTTTTATTVAVVADYQDGATWSSLSGAYPASAWAGSGYRLAVGVPMLPDGSIPGVGLLAGASGLYDVNFATLAQHLVEEGAGDAIVRLGWEWDQHSFAWYAGNATDAANYAAYWQQIVTTMRGVPGAHFDFSWYYGGGGSALTAEAWPGGDYVDSITLDLYDQTWDSNCGLMWNNTASAAQSQCVWDESLLPILNGLATFATAQGEPIGFGEWGVISRSDGHGLGDDPLFVDNLAAWAGSHDVEYANYFDANSGGNSVLTDFPNALTAFTTDFAVPTSTPTTATATSSTAASTTSASASASASALTSTPDTATTGSNSPSAPGSANTQVTPPQEILAASAAAR